ncbi:tRNA pseudouridine synthase A [Stygiolobus caldivivus]|uniref:tRNA pseudouridine synthase A n=1 Tax=Stygiolobus caldivivus TaxID=2824673 RepID=A0A8D5U8G7_9CREN|nr:tRNA pseudouridine synthase A [Stygiolobus caldivivus]BCU70674.1 tRNA pseudouridine synthase A [Stygiolobus caldivivus]
MYKFLEKIDSFCGYINNWSIIRDAQTNDKYGFYADKRPIDILIKNSIINLDKPPGPTSHEVAYWIKKMLNLNKVGHGGTLEHV